MKRTSLAIAFVSASLLLVGCYGPPPTATGDDAGEDDGGGDDPPDECVPVSEGGSEPGFPYSIETFRSEALPVLVASCGTVNCHKEPAGTGNFIVWSNAATDDCNFGKTFNQVANQVDLDAPADSRLLQAPSGGSTTHPPVLPSTTAGYASLKLYIDDAVLRADAGGGDDGGDDDDPGASDPVFADVIQPLLDSYGCTKNGCHGTGLGGFKLVANATGADLEANLAQAKSRNNASDPTLSRIYFKGRNAHSGSEVYSAADAAKVLAWVTDNPP
jgi:hypothetical protein